MRFKSGRKRKVSFITRSAKSVLVSSLSTASARILLVKEPCPGLVIAVQAIRQYNGTSRFEESRNVGPMTPAIKRVWLLADEGRNCTY